MENKVLLIDGTSHIFRAYFRVGMSLTTKEGQNIGAVYTFCLMLKKLLNHYPHTPIILFFDAGGKNFRHDLYPEYKAHREKPEDDLIAQIELCHQVASLYGFPVIKRHGVEADDLIGTVARCYEKIAQVEIHSPDKDFMQLVSENIRVVVDEKTSYKVYDRAGVEEKYTIKPDLFRDFLALKGDKSDNIPGLKGCGDKTAAKWLNSYGPLESIIEHQHDITGKIGQTFRESLEIIDLSRALVTIDTAQPWPEQLDAHALPKPPKIQQKELFEFFAAYGFESLQPKVIEHIQTLSQDKTFLVVSSLDELEALFEQLKKASCIAFDLETTSLNLFAGSIIGLSFCIDPQKAFYLPLSSFNEEEELFLKKTLKELFLTHQFVAHHGKFDAQFLLEHWGCYPQHLDDTMILASLLEKSGPFDLKSLALKRLNWQLEGFDEVLKKEEVHCFSQVSLESQSLYAGLDALSTYSLYQYYRQLLDQEETLRVLYESLERPFLLILLKMQHRGIILDQSYLGEIKKTFAQEKEELEQAVFKEAGQEFALGSTKQLRQVLFDSLGCPVVEKTPKGLASTNESALAQLAKDYPICDLLLKWRHLDKLMSTYTDSLIEKVQEKTGAIHTQYHQTGTITGRLSSSEPNLQNIPIKSPQGKMIRKAFKARPGKVLLSADYSQIELRLMAHFSQDPSLIKAYQASEDIHRLTASKIYHCDLEAVDAQMRRHAKMVNFGLIYGMSPWGLSRQLHLDLKTAELFHQRFFEQYPKVKDYMTQMENMAKQFGYVKTLLGRKIFVRFSKNSQMNLRSAINGPLQGTASDLIKTAMRDLDQTFSSSDQIALLMQVHDELVFEVSEDKVKQYEPMIKEKMEKAFELSVPLEVNTQISKVWSGD